MTKIFSLLLCVALFSLNARAATDDASDSSTNNLVNLDYYNHLGHLIVESSFNSAIHAGSFSQDESFTNINFLASYAAFIPGLRFTVSANDDMYAYSAESPNSTYSTGFTNPAFTASYRFLENVSSGVGANAAFTVTPSFGTRKSAIPIEPGNNAQAAPSIQAVVTGFLNQGMNEISLNANVMHAFSGKISEGDENFTDDSVTRTDFTTSSYWLVSSTLTDRIHLLPQAYVQGSVEFQFGHSENYTDTSNNNVSTDQIGFHVYPTVEAGYLVAKNALLSAFITGYHYTVNNDNIPSYMRSVFATSFGLRGTFEL